MTIKREKITEYNVTDKVIISLTSSENSSTEETYIPLNYDVTKAIWLSQFDMNEVYQSGGKQRSRTDFELLAKRIVKNIKSLGINTVFYQLRPNGDSIYPSDIFPASKYVTGCYGVSHTYDPVEIFIRVAHEEMISVHGWINPLRCMSQSDISMISHDYTIKRWYDDKSPYIKVVNGICYLDPAYSEVINLICGGIEEIIDKYDIDGIHIDDYFYPTTSEGFDSLAYNSYRSSGGILSLDDFRRENINNMVQRIYASVKSKNSALPFGISPSGNTERNYNTLYADVKKWCEGECYVDYICPQIYFGFEHSSCPFDGVAEEFSNMVKNKDIKLIIGMSLGKAFSGYNGTEDTWAGEGKREWIENLDVLFRSVKYTEEIENCEGIAFFCYQYFYDPLSGLPRSETENECSLLLPAIKKFE
ncbi:MAG: hypothetical protein E7641_02555 [Ruminococcaceae bacterium]|nr:hypothetical protein [Oscillospiraceae bacterium]